MLNTEHERPGLDEQYIMATNASDLTVDPNRVTAADHLIAAGLVGNRMASVLSHLVGEWTVADKPPKPTDFDAELRAELLFCALGVGHKKKPDIKRARTELLNSYNRALSAVYQSLPSKGTAIAIMREWSMRRGVDVDSLSPALYHHINPTCSVCDGRGKLLMPDAPVLGKECFTCGGTGKRKLSEHSKRALNWLDGCVGKNRSERSGVRHDLHGNLTPMADRLRGPVEAEQKPEVNAAVAAVARASMNRGKITP